MHTHTALLSLYTLLKIIIIINNYVSSVGANKAASLIPVLSFTFIIAGCHLTMVQSALAGRAMFSCNPREQSTRTD